MLRGNEYDFANRRARGGDEIVLGRADFVALSVGLLIRYRTSEQEEALATDMMRREQVRLVNVVLFCCSPFFIIAAEKSPGYWKRFRTGAVHMPLREVLLKTLEETSQADLDATFQGRIRGCGSVYQSDEVYPPNAPKW